MNLSQGLDPLQLPRLTLCSQNMMQPMGNRVTCQSQEGCLATQPAQRSLHKLIWPQCLASQKEASRWNKQRERKQAEACRVFSRREGRAGALRHQHKQRSLQPSRLTHAPSTLFLGAPAGQGGEGEQEQSGGLEPGLGYTHRSGQQVAAAVMPPAPGQQRCLNGCLAEKQEGAKRGDVNQLKEKGSQIQGLPASSFPKLQNPRGANISEVCI